MQSKTFNFCVETVFGALPPMSVKAANEPMRLKEVVPFVQKIASDIVSLAAQKSEEEGWKVTCSAGCDTCFTMLQSGWELCGNGQNL